MSACQVTAHTACEQLLREQIAQEIETESMAFVDAAANVVSEDLRTHLTEIAWWINNLATRVRRAS